MDGSKSLLDEESVLVSFGILANGFARIVRSLAESQTLSVLSDHPRFLLLPSAHACS
jgi:hypothetical protein